MNDIKQKRILLLIDDEINLQQLMKIALKSKNYEVETAGNGLEGLAKLETMKPDLIILDINMPKMGGLEFYRRICDAANNPKYPVLVVTARAQMDQTLKQLQLAGYMSKPFEIAELLQQVDTVMQKPQ
jgi:DNA-binding response OmpR family regulator